MNISNRLSFAEDANEAAFADLDKCMNVNFSPLVESVKALRSMFKEQSQLITSLESEVTQCQRENSELSTEAKLMREEIVSLKLRIHALEGRHGIKHKASSPLEKYDKYPTGKKDSLERNLNDDFDGFDDDMEPQQIKRESPPMLKYEVSQQWNLDREQEAEDEPRAEEYTYNTPARSKINERNHLGDLPQKSNVSPRQVNQTDSQMTDLEHSKRKREANDEFAEPPQKSLKSGDTASPTPITPSNNASPSAADLLLKTLENDASNSKEVSKTESQEIFNRGKRDSTLGDEACRLSEFRKAISHYDVALKLFKSIDQSNPHPNEMTSTHCNRATCYGKLGLWEEADHDASQACRIRPDWWKGYSIRGTLLSKQRRFAPSVEFFKQAEMRCDNDKDREKIATKLRTVQKKLESERAKALRSPQKPKPQPSTPTKISPPKPTSLMTPTRSRKGTNRKDSPSKSSASCAPISPEERERRQNAKQNADYIKKELRRYTNAALKELLGRNRQPMGGAKAILIARCLDGFLYGSIPKCPTCVLGFLKYDASTKQYTCSGHFNGPTKRVVPCNFKSSDVQRGTWEA